MPVSKIRDFGELPAVLKADDIARALGISRSLAFTLAKRPGFPAVRVNERRIVIPRDRFLAWLDNQADKPLE